MNLDLRITGDTDTGQMQVIDNTTGLILMAVEQIVMTNDPAEMSLTIKGLKPRLILAESSLTCPTCEASAKDGGNE